MENCVAPCLDEFDVLLEVVLSLVRVGASVVNQKHKMQRNCPDSYYNFQNINISKV